MPRAYVTDLTTAQVQAIYQGRIGNWAALGGPDMPIIPVSRGQAAAIQLSFQTMVMNARRMTTQARLAPSSQAVLDIVSEQPGAVGYVSLGLAQPGVRPLAINGITPALAGGTDYPLQTTIDIIGRAEPQDTLYRALFAWMQSPDGQAVVARHYTPVWE